MYEYEIKFLSLDKSLLFKFKSRSEEEMIVLVNNLFTLFESTKNDDGTVGLETLIINNEEWKLKINNFISDHLQYIPEANAIKAFFRNLGENTPFLFLACEIKEQKEFLKLYHYLRAEMYGENIKELNNTFDSLYNNVLSNYEFKVFGNTRLSIGTKERAYRICRFCNNESTPLSFKTKAHAISEALGNKNIILNEECDTCNKKFSKSTEQDIIEYLKLYRTVFNVKGKKGEKKWKGVNFEMHKDEKIHLKYTGEMDEIKPRNMLPEIILDSDQKVSKQNIYRALCKFFISVINKEHLAEFSNTIKWINGDLQIEKLPKIAEIVSFKKYSEIPIITTYIKKSEDLQLPFAIGEFAFTCKTFVFIIPMVKSDKISFLNENEYNKVWNTLSHYQKIKGWTHNDYSNNEKKKFRIKLKFNQES